MLSGNKGCSILLLGGAQFQVDAIRAANALGIRTVLCDYLPDNPGQFEADVFYQTSTTDYGAVLEVAKKEHVSGVLSFGSDVAAPIAARVSTTLGFPTNPVSAVETLSTKHRFRSFLQSHGFLCPQTVSFSTSDDPREVADRLSDMHFPVMVKPTDSSGSKGITLLENHEPTAVAHAMDTAKAFSRNGILIAEERIGSTRPQIIGGDVFVRDGIIQFWGLMRCLRDYRLDGLVPVGKAYPLGYSADTEQRVRDTLQRLVTELGIQFGEMNVEVILDEDEMPYVIELAARAGGNFIPTQLRDVSGIDLVRASVQCAMGQNPGSVEFDANDKYIMMHVIHSLASGKLDRIAYADDLRASLYREIRYYSAGDTIPRFVNAADALGIAFFEFPDVRTMDAHIQQLHNEIVVSISS